MAAIRRYKTNEPVPANLVTQTRFVQAAKITIGEFRLLLRNHHIKAVALTPGYIRLYDLADVDRVVMMKDPDTRALPRRKGWTPQSYTVEEGTRVMRLLDQGIGLDRIYLDHEPGIHPVRLEAIRDKYVQLSGAVLMRKPAIDLLSTLPVDGATLPLRTDEDVVAFVRLALREQLCAYCRTARRSSQCVACTRSVLRREEKARASAAEARGRSSSRSRGESMVNGGLETSNASALVDVEDDMTATGEELVESRTLSQGV